MNKFKNYSFMFGLVSAVLMVVVQILAAFEIYISSETVSTIVSVILGGLVVIGVVNKPSESEKTEASEKFDKAILLDDKMESNEPSQNDEPTENKG